MKQRPCYVVLHATGSDDLVEQVTDAAPKGFHFLIDQDGVIYPGLREEEEGAHTKGKNTGSIGIILVGRRYFSAPQMDSLFSIYLSLNYRWGIEPKAWYSSHEFDSRLPQCFEIDDLRDRLMTL